MLLGVHMWASINVFCMSMLLGSACSRLSDHLRRTQLHRRPLVGSLEAMKPLSNQQSPTGAQSPEQMMVHPRQNPGSSWGRSRAAPGPRPQRNKHPDKVQKRSFAMPEHQAELCNRQVRQQDTLTVQFPMHQARTHVNVAQNLSKSAVLQVRYWLPPCQRSTLMAEQVQQDRTGELLDHKTTKWAQPPH